MKRKFVHIESSFLFTYYIVGGNYVFISVIECVVSAVYWSKGTTKAGKLTLDELNSIVY